MIRPAILSIVLAVAATSTAQQATRQGPPVKVNVLNVCSPTEDEQREISVALAQLPRQPRFSTDFEVARGHSTVQGIASDWVHVRREFPSGNFNVAQFAS